MKRVMGNSKAGIAAAALVAVCFRGHARASLVKPNGSPAVHTASTLGVALRSRSDLERTHAAVRAREPGACAAAAIRLPSVGIRIVTARHCAADAVAIYDEHHRAASTGYREVSAGVDLAVLDVKGRLPWPGLEPRSTDTLELGERVCAFRVESRGGGFERERICARVIGRVSRPDAPPLLETSHPYPPGTSGSALVDPKGRVAGIVVASTGTSGLAEPLEPLLAWAERDLGATRTLRQSSAETTGSLR